MTGARGFAGAWLAKALLEEGRTVVSLDKGRPERPVSTLRLLGIEEEVEDVSGDLNDGELMERAARRAQGGFRLPPRRGDDRRHRAGLAGARVRDERARDLDAPRRLPPSRRRAGRRRLLGQGVRRATTSFRTARTSRSRATAPYEASKAAADIIARSYWHSYGLPVAVTRFANIYGGGDLNFSRLIPEAACAAVDGRPPVLRSDGSPERDFLYVEDAASAYLAIAGALDRDDVRGEAFNAGGGEPHSVGEVVAAIARLSGTGVEPDIQGEGNPEGEIDRQWVDPTKLRERCGWTPAVGLEEGLRRTLDWYREHPEARPPD